MRTFGLSDFRTFGLSDEWAEVIECVLQSMGAGHGSGGRRPPPRWQVTVRERRECPVRSTPSGSFRALEPSANHHARVARKPRMNGHTAIAGGRCLDAGFMPPPRSRSIARSSVRRQRCPQLPNLPFRTNRTEPKSLLRNTKEGTKSPLGGVARGRFELPTKGL